MSLFSEFREEALKRADQVRLLKQKIEAFEPFTVPPSVPGTSLTPENNFLPSRSDRLAALRERAARAARDR